MEIIDIMDCFDDVEVQESHDGYFYKVSEVIKIIILGCLRGLKNVRQIRRWAVSDRVSEFLKEKFAIERVPRYYWILCPLKMLKPESLNDCFKRWVSGFMPAYEPEGENSGWLTITGDGSLDMTGGIASAGIGSGKQKHTSNIRIEGGTITARGSVSDGLPAARGLAAALAATTAAARDSIS